ncbi:MerR family transcriptional regulator [Lacticaseibacillus sharpeae]|uniref:Transcription regulator of multidrug-efflux transporter n=1 Tax=Lacticaseibacillus sharpeae JCM 1186 = DSM 20505 TaxID=1291052 RepID=A0A0R1ZTT7_9LACO|nr:MerR family transcriptional regulator [Lacticaseibacillus sharpeae]KRM55174.1 transcription regulator of multidrug-efflux transporter [Lacticaseibacillus sharpeae JCM 1186 = DSM 20505]
MSNVAHTPEFTIGQMSQLHHIPVKTLRYYDEIGLFAPHRTDARTGYRYYVADQFELLNTIHYLRTLGIPIKEIKQHLAARNLDAFLSLLTNQLAATQAQIKALQHTAARFEARIDAIHKARNITALDQPQLISRPREPIVLLQDQIHTNSEIELALRQLGNDSGEPDNLFIGNIGLTISQDNLLNGKFATFSSIFMTATAPSALSIPAGQFVRIVYNGDHQVNAPRYRKILAYIAAQNLTVTGDAVERTIIDHYISADPADYLTEILVPVK